MELGVLSDGSPPRLVAGLRSIRVWGLTVSRHAEELTPDFQQHLYMVALGCFCHCEPLLHYNRPQALFLHVPPPFLAKSVSFTVMIGRDGWVKLFSDSKPGMTTKNLWLMHVNSVSFSVSCLADCTKWVKSFHSTEVPVPLPQLSPQEPSYFWSVHKQREFH